MAFRGRIQHVTFRLVHYTHDRLATVDEGYHDRELPVLREKLLRPIQRIDNPDALCRKSHSRVFRLLGKHSVFRKGGGQRRQDHGVRGVIRLRYRRCIWLVFRHHVPVMQHGGFSSLPCRLLCYALLA